MIFKLQKASLFQIMPSIKSQFIIITIWYVLTSCASNSVKSSGTDSNTNAGKSNRLVRCESKAIVKDLEHNKTHKLSVDFLAAGNSQMRMEVSALLGVGLASILFKDNQTKYASYREKKYYRIQDFNRSLEDVFKVPLRPNYFFKLLYGQTFEDPNWNCTQNSRKLVEHCTQEKENIEINWTYELNGKRQIIIKSPKTEITWMFGQLQAEANPNPQAFTLEAPKGFSIINL